MTSLLFTLSLSLAPQAFQPSYYNGHTKRARYHSTRTSMSLQQTRQLAEGVEFDTICREWRCKWSLDGDKASLVACQMALESVAEDLYQVDGVKAVERVVCGECLDFKVITSVSAEKFDEWKKSKFDPEEDFFEMLRAIGGVSQIETQTYTKMPVTVTDFSDDED